MTKKTTSLFLLGISILVLTSCFSSSSSSDSNKDINQVLGSWNLTKASLKELKNDMEKAADGIVTSFTLNSDSTATVVFGDAENKNLNGTWIWQAKKEIGNESFGFSISSDVVIRVNGLYTLGLQLEKGKLVAGEYTFDKQN